MPATLDRPTHKRVRGWNHGESMFTLASGGESFGRSLKKKAIATVQVVTDDGEIALGYLLRNDESLQVRVGHCVGYMGDNYYITRHQEWRVDAVCRERIERMVYLS